MNKTYLAIILVLLVLVVAVGGYAFYKANKQELASKAVLPTPTITVTPTVQNSPTVAPNNTNDSLSNQIPLSITTLKDGDKVTTASLLVSGITSPAADVNINGTDLVANSSGKFSTTLTLDEGTNSVYVTAVDQNGNVSEWNANVTYEPAQ